MISIDQLLESVDLDFEPRWVTKDGEGGAVMIWKRKPTPREEYGAWVLEDSYAYEFVVLNRLKLSEFANKHWQDCIYEVPRKTTGKIELLTSDGGSHPDHYDFMQKINELVMAVNELKGMKNE